MLRPTNDNVLLGNSKTKGNSPLPVQGDGGHWIDAGEDGRYREEVVKAAVDQAEVPLVVHGVDEVDHRVEGGHGGFGERQVQEEIVGDCPHAFVRHNNPNHRDIADHRHDDYTAVRNGPEDDSPDWLNKLVRVCGPVIGGVGAVGQIRHIGGVE